jgi:PadR family transcriptional regulator, regulatory protein PadR
MRGTLVLTSDTNRCIIVSTSDTMTSRLDLLQGTLDLLILRTLDKEPRHGWAISERIQEISRDVLQVNQGSLYPALHRLEHQGWIASEWGVSELGRRARFYKITAAGKKQLGAESEQWERFTEAVGRVMRYA